MEFVDIVKIVKEIFQKVKFSTFVAVFITAQLAQIIFPYWGEKIWVLLIKNNELIFTTINYLYYFVFLYTIVYAILIINHQMLALINSNSVIYETIDKMVNYLILLFYEYALCSLSNWTEPLFGYMEVTNRLCIFISGMTCLILSILPYIEERRNSRRD